MSRQVARRANRDWFDDFFETPFNTSFVELALPDERFNSKEMRRWMPQTDVSETDKAIKITANLPGMKKEDINIDFDEETRNLKLHGEYTQEKKEDNEKFHSIERHYGKFDRNIRLPRNADVDNIRASVQDGVLYVEVPKQTEQKKKTRMISVQ
jgi:HSP20 family protein